MAGKRGDIEAQIAALQKELEGADDDDDFEIEIFSEGKGARLPFRQGKSWLEENLGLKFGSPAADAGDGGDGGDGQGGAAGAAGTGKGGTGGKPASTSTPAARSYFGGKR